MEVAGPQKQDWLFIQRRKLPSQPLHAWLYICELIGRQILQGFVDLKGELYGIGREGGFLVGELVIRENWTVLSFNHLNDN